MKRTCSTAFGADSDLQHCAQVAPMGRYHGAYAEIFRRMEETVEKMMNEFDLRESMKAWSEAVFSRRLAPAGPFEMGRLAPASPFEMAQQREELERLVREELALANRRGETRACFSAWAACQYNATKATLILRAWWALVVLRDPSWVSAF